MRAVLVTIADAANRDGEYARPGIAAIVEGSLYGKSHVSRILAKLISDRWLEVMEQGNGRGFATVYRVLMETSPSVGGLENPPIGGAKPPHLAAETSPFGDSLPLSSTVENNGREQPRDPFDAFWSTYPRKEAKKAAREAFAAACKRERPEVILAGAERYRDDPNRDPSFTKHATTWLRADCWADDPLPSRSKPILRGPHRPTAIDTDRTAPSGVIRSEDL